MAIAVYAGEKGVGVELAPWIGWMPAEHVQEIAERAAEVLCQVGEEKGAEAAESGKLIRLVKGDDDGTR